jgi:hypothetical protein
MKKSGETVRERELPEAHARKEATTHEVALAGVVGRAVRLHGASGREDDLRAAGRCRGDGGGGRGRHRCGGNSRGDGGGDARVGRGKNGARDGRGRRVGIRDGHGRGDCVDRRREDRRGNHRGRRDRGVGRARGHSRDGADALLLDHRGGGVLRLDLAVLAVARQRVVQRGCRVADDVLGRRLHPRTLARAGRAEGGAKRGRVDLVGSPLSDVPLLCRRCSQHHLENRHWVRAEIDGRDGRGGDSRRDGRRGGHGARGCRSHRHRNGSRDRGCADGGHGVRLGDSLAVGRGRVHHSRHVHLGHHGRDNRRDRGGRPGGNNGSTSDSRRVRVDGADGIQDSLGLVDAVCTAPK